MPTLLSLAILLAAGGDPGDVRPAAVLAPIRVAAFPAPARAKQEEPPAPAANIYESLPNPYSTPLAAPAHPPAWPSYPSTAPYYIAPATNVAPAELPPPMSKLSLQAGPSAKVRHLQEAADHLEAAGLHEEAKMVRQRAAAEDIQRKQRELAAKIRQFESLRREIAALSREVAPQKDRNVVMQISVLEMKESVWKQKVEPLLIAYDCNDFDGEGDKAAFVFDHYRDWKQAVEELVIAKDVKQLAAPMLATIDGVECEIQTGGQIPSIVEVDGKKAIKFQSFGTHFKVCPKLGEDRDLTLKVVGDITAAKASPKKGAHEEILYTIEKKFDCEVQAAMQLGQCLAIFAPAEKAEAEKDDAKSPCTLVIIHAADMK